MAIPDFIEVEYIPVSSVKPVGSSTDNKNCCVSDEVIERIKEILSVDKFVNLSLARDAFLAAFELLAKAHDLYTVSYEHELSLIKAIDFEVTWKTEFSVGSGEIHYDLSKIIKLLEANDAKEFLDETDAFKKNLISGKGEIELDPYTKWAVSFGSKYDALSGGLVFTGAFTITKSNEKGDYFSQTLEFKRTISPTTSFGNKDSQTHGSDSSEDEQEEGSTESINESSSIIDVLDEVSTGLITVVSVVGWGVALGAGGGAGVALLTAAIKDCGNPLTKMLQLSGT